MTLREAQAVFAQGVAQLLQEAVRQGFTVTLGEAYRPAWVAQEYARQGKGVYPSVHTERLAVDLNLFRDGTYLRDTESYAPLGIWWEAQHDAFRWGGRFTQRDGNHFSMRWGRLA